MRQDAFTMNEDAFTPEQVVSITEQTRGSRRWPRRLLDRVRGQSSSATTARAEVAHEEYDAEDDEEEEEDEAIGSAILHSSALPTGQLSAAPLPQLVHAIVPESAAFDLSLAEPGAPPPVSSGLDVNFETMDFYGAAPGQPPLDGGWQGYSGGELYARASSFTTAGDVPAAELQLPGEASAKEEKRVPSTKRVTGVGEQQQDVSPGLKQEADGDGRRKKARRGPPATAPSPDGGSNKKFACPYFKRNPKKYHKWTSCPGPGWDEVHRVKYGYHSFQSMRSC